MLRALLVVLLLAGLLVGLVWTDRTSWWGALALGTVLLAGYVVYRRRVARAAQVEKFFGDAGEETRLTVQPSELPPRPPSHRGAGDNG